MNKTFTVVLFLVVIALFLITVVCVIKSSSFCQKQLSLKQSRVPKPPVRLQLLHAFGNNDIAVLDNNPNDFTREYCYKYKLDYLYVPVEKGADESVVWMYLYHFLKRNPHEYVVLLHNAKPWNANSNKPLQRLIQQSGDSDLILCRDAFKSNKLGINMFVFKNTEWSVYKCLQLYFQPQNIQTLLLDQVYTKYKHSSLLNSKPQLDAGLTYNLQCTCVYNEKAFDLGNLVADMYPWTNVPGFIEIPKRVLPTIKAGTTKQKIPRVIYQTMSTTLSNLERYEFSVKAWQDLNPEYEYCYFDSLDCRKFIEKHFESDVVKAYNMLLPGAYQADLFRYCLLYVQGGCYVDSQTQPFLPLRDVLSPETELCSAIDYKNFSVWQGFLCSIPEHPAIKLAIDTASANILKQKYFDSDLQLVGPDLMGMSINQSLGRLPKQDLSQGLPSTIQLLCHTQPDCQPYVYFNKTKFLLGKYFYNKDQLQSSLVKIDQVSGKENYAKAHEKKRIFKTKLLA